ncbi:MAG: SIMPL domain-containing protein [Pseudomonadota bacterium]
MRHWMMMICALACLGWAGAAQAAGGVVEVTGVGEVSAVPDMAALQVGVAVEAAQAEVAVRQMAQRQGEVLARIEGLGLAPRDIQTSQMTLSPVWDQGQGTPRAVRGYIARSVVTVRVRDLQVLGTLLDVAVRDGATEFGGLRFMLADPAPAKAAARAAAVRDAAEKAGQMAAAAGLSLGPVQRLVEHGGGGRGPGDDGRTRRDGCADGPRRSHRARGGWRRLRPEVALAQAPTGLPREEGPQGPAERRVS